MLDLLIDLQMILYTSCSFSGGRCWNKHRMGIADGKHYRG